MLEPHGAVGSNRPDTNCKLPPMKCETDDKEMGAGALGMNKEEEYFMFC